MGNKNSKASTSHKFRNPSAPTKQQKATLAIEHQKATLAIEHQKAIALIEHQKAIAPIEQQKEKIAYILTIPDELYITITSYLDKKYHLPFANACTGLRNRYIDCNKKETFSLIYGPRSITPLSPEYIKALEHRLNQTTGWKHTMPTIILVWRPQYNPKYLAKPLQLKEPFELLTEVNGATIDTLILEFLDWKTKSKLDVAFLKKFINLKSLRLDNACIDDDIVSTLSKLSLGSIFLNHCTIEDRHSSKILETCTTLEDIQIVDCKYSYIADINLPPQLKIFKIIECLDYQAKINLSLCTQLEDLSIRSSRGAKIEIVSSEVESLRTLELECEFQSTDCFEKSLAKLEKLKIYWPYMSNCQTFGSDEMSTINDRHLDLSSFKFFKELYIMKATPPSKLRLKLSPGFGFVYVMGIYEERGRDPIEKMFNRNSKTPTDESIYFEERPRYQSSLNRHN